MASLLPFELRTLRGARRVYARDLCLTQLSRGSCCRPVALYFILQLPNHDKVVYQSELCHQTRHPLWRPLPHDLVARYGDVVQLDFRLYAVFTASRATPLQNTREEMLIVSMQLDTRRMFYAGASSAEADSMSSCSGGVPAVHTAHVNRTKSNHPANMTGSANEVHSLAKCADSSRRSNTKHTCSYSMGFLYVEYEDGVFGTPLSPACDSVKPDRPGTQAPAIDVDRSRPAVGDEVCWLRSPAGRAYYIHDDTLTAEHDNLSDPRSNREHCGRAGTRALGDSNPTMRHVLTVCEMDGLALAAVAWSEMEQLAQARYAAQVTQMHRHVATSAMTKRAVARTHRRVLQRRVRVLRARAEQECAMLEDALHRYTKGADVKAEGMSDVLRQGDGAYGGDHAEKMRKKNSCECSLTSSSSGSSKDETSMASSDEYVHEESCDEFDRVGGGDAAARHAAELQHAELRARLARLRECRTRELRAAFPIQLAAPSHIRSRCGNESNKNGDSTSSNDRSCRQVYDTIAGLRLPFFAVHEMTDMTRQRSGRHNTSQHRGRAGNDAVRQGSEVGETGSRNDTNESNAQDAKDDGEKVRTDAAALATAASTAVSTTTPSSSLATSLLAVALPVTMWTNTINTSTNHTANAAASATAAMSSSSSAAVMYEEGLALSYAARILRTLAVLYNCALPYPVILAGSRSRVLVTPDVDVTRATAALVGQRGVDVKLPLYCTRAAERPRLVRAVRLLMYNARVLGEVMGRGEDVLMGCNLRIGQALCILLDPDYRF